MRLKIIAAFFLFSSFVIDAQVIINELMPSNSSTIADENGDYSDWLELFNTSDSAVYIAGYGISDDSSDFYKWITPDITIPAKDHILIFASDKNRRNQVYHWETIITWGDEWNYFIGTEEPPENWKNINFDAQGWEKGKSGFGYGDDDDSTIVPVVQSVYIRKNFPINNINDISAAVLHLDFDDAFVAYLNGIEIARYNIGIKNIPPSYNQSADNAREALIYSGGIPETYPVEEFQSILKEGDNILAIQVHNYGTNSSDLTLIPFFSLGLNFIPPDAGGTHPLLQFPKGYLHTNFKLDSNGERLFLTDPQGNITDRVTTGILFSDISYGRYPDGSEFWFYFDEATPGNSNTASGYNGFANKPEFSLTSGLYPGTIEVSLSGAPSNEITRYTTDGSIPTENSAVYSQPIIINKTKIIRARNFAAGLIPGKTVTNTYLINFSADLPVFSISTDQENFFDNESGIYVLGNNAETSYPYLGANFWMDWEKPVHVEFFDLNSSGFSIDAGVKIFGGWSRGQPQKSLSIFAREGYGYPEINFPLFPDLPFAEYESFILRNSGNDWQFSMFRDGLMTTLVDGIDIDKQHFRPAILLLNGEYWGIHNLREKVNEDFIASHHNVNRDSIDMLENFGEIVTGDNSEYLKLYNFIQNNNLSVPANFQYVQSKIDMDNFKVYYVSQIYFDNTDWPGNNIKYWKKKRSGKWRWIMFDTDFGFSLYGDGFANNTLSFALEPNGPDWPNPPWSTLLLRKLLTNQTFRKDFINCAADLLNTNFLPEKVTQQIISFRDKISSEISRHINRWQPFSLTSWNNDISRMINFANKRPGYLRQHFIQQFDLQGTTSVNVTISDTTMGSVKLNSVEINTSDWTGIYFQNVPITVVAKPKRGYRFVNWDRSNPTDEDTITVTPSGTVTLAAVFEIDPYFVIPKIVINEINYNSLPSFNPEDWVELYNNSDTSVNISGWIFKDSEDDHIYIIPEGTTLGGKEFLVLCNSDNLFHPLFANVGNYIGNFGFGLSGSGELIRLFDSDLNIIDSLTYSDSDPWPEVADGNGPTLSLKNPDMENHLSQNWAASSGYGTPGSKNDVYVSIEESTEQLPSEFALYQNYPNPFNPVTTIRYSIIRASNVLIRIYDILGNEVRTLVSEFKQPGFHKAEFNAGELSSGIYFYRITADNFVNTKKLILLK